MHLHVSSYTEIDLWLFPDGFPIDASHFPETHFVWGGYNGLTSEHVLLILLNV